MLNNKSFLDGLLDEAGGMDDGDFVTVLSKTVAPMVKDADGDEEEESKGSAPSETSVIEFLRKNPRPKDKQFHEWAKSRGVNVHKAESTAYGILSDLLTKGRSKGKHPGGVAQEDVREGVRIETEHTPNKEIQRKITDDHNTELKKYYDKKKGLPAMEKALEKATVKKPEVRSPSDLMTFLRSRGHRVSSSQPLGPMPKSASFLEGFVDELQKLGYNGSTATTTIRPGSTESKSLRKALKAKGVWEGKSPGLLQRAAHGLRRLGRQKSTAHFRVTKSQKPEKKESLSSMLGGSLSGIPSLSKVAFLDGFIDELQKLGVSFGKTPGKPMKIRATLRRLKRFVSGAPKSQLERMRRKEQARKAAHAFGGSEKDLRGAARGGKMMLGAGMAMLKREARLSVRAGRRLKGVGPALSGFIERNPGLAFMVGAPAAVVGGSAAAGALARLLKRKKKKRMKKKAGFIDNLSAGGFKSSRKFKELSPWGKRVVTGAKPKYPWHSESDVNEIDAVSGIMHHEEQTGKRVSDEDISRRLWKKNITKIAGPPTLAKLRRAYPKGKVKPPVADPGAPVKAAPEFPKAANIVGGVMNSMTKAFFFGLTDELSKAANDEENGDEKKDEKKDDEKEKKKEKEGEEEDKGKKKGLFLGKEAMDIKAKIQAARRDPSTKANPKDEGPKGSGTRDPRFLAQKGQGFGKAGGFFSSASGKAKAVELNKHIQRAGGDVKAGVKSYNEAKKGEKGKKGQGLGKGAGVISGKIYEKITGKKKKKLFGKGGLIIDTEKKKGEKKPMKKKAEEVFFSGFDQALGKDAATAIPKTTPGAAEARRVAALHLKKFQGRVTRKTLDDPKGKMARGYRGVLSKMYGGGKGK